MNPLRSMSFALCLLPWLLSGMPSSAQAQTFHFKPVTLSAELRASLQRYLADTLPAQSFDWNSLAAHKQSTGGKRHPLSVTLSTVPAMTAAGVCRSEQHHIYVERGKGRWQANDDLTNYYAWPAQGGDCAAASTPITVGKTLTDADFLIIERGKDALRSRAAGVIGGSDCARVRFCEVSLRRINRLREESPSRASRVLTRLTFSPTKPGPECLYVMEVSFVGPINELVPLGASCPKP